MLIHYFKIFLACAKNSLKRETEFRANFILGVLLEIIALALTFLLVDVQFLYTSEIAGWTKGQVIFLIGVLKIAEGIMDATFTKNILKIPGEVRSGNLDLYLSKPVKSQFLLSFRYFSIYELSNVVAGLLILSYANHAFFLGLTLGNAMWLGLLMLIGMASFYSILLIMVSVSFWAKKFQAMRVFHRVLVAPLGVPLDIFGPKGKALLTYIIPLALVVTIPSGVTLGITSTAFVITVFIIAACFLVASNIIWNLALKHYSSASS